MTFMLHYSIAVCEGTLCTMFMQKTIEGPSVLPQPTKQSIIYTDNHVQCTTLNNTKMLHGDTSSQKLTPLKHHKTRIRNMNPRIRIQSRRHRSTLQTRASRDPRKIQPTCTPLQPATPKHRVDHREEGRDGKEEEDRRPYYSGFISNRIWRNQQLRSCPREEVVPWLAERIGGSEWRGTRRRGGQQVVGDANVDVFLRGGILGG
jgi:hypothetical protein